VPLAFRTNTTLGFFHYAGTANPAWFEHIPFHYQMSPSLTYVLLPIGATNAEAVLLLDSTALFESRHKHTKRTVWNWAGGGLIAATEGGLNLTVVALDVFSGSCSTPVPIRVDPFWHSSNSLQHIVALVDARTREVLWLSREDFKRKDPHDAEILMVSVAGTMADLPPIP